MINIRVPASSANLGPGFDVLGLALAIYNEVELELNPSFSLEISGEGQESLTGGRDNLFWKTIERFYQEKLGGSRPPPMAIKMKNNIPLARGLGSSASVIVAAVAAANVLSRRGLGRDEIFDLAAAIEGHPDNVAAAVYGQITAAYPTGGKPAYRAVALKPHPDLAPLIIIPNVKLATKTARGALPNQIDYRDAVFNLSRVALLVKALTEGDFDLLAAATEDRLHQPFRTKLIPDLSKVIEICYRSGAKGAALSGAGPSIIAFTAKGEQVRLSLKIQERLSSAGIDYQVKICDIDHTGLTVSAD